MAERVQLEIEKMKQSIRKHGYIHTYMYMYKDMHIYIIYAGIHTYITLHTLHTYIHPISGGRARPSFPPHTMTAFQMGPTAAKDLRRFFAWLLQ